MNNSLSQVNIPYPDSRWDEGGDLLKLYDLTLEKQTAVCSVIGDNSVINGVPITVKEDEIVNIIEYSGDEPDGDRVISEDTGGEGNIFEEHTWEGQGDESNPEEESADNDNGRTDSPDSEVLTFDAPEPKPEPKKRKSQLEQLGIPKPEKRELTEDEQKKAEELASEFGSFLTPEKSVDSWKSLDTENSF